MRADRVASAPRGLPAAAGAGRSSGALVREVSPVAGLQRRSLGGWEVGAQSVAVTAPSMAMAATPALVAATAGYGAVYAYLIAAGVILLVGYCISQFARRMASAGSLYTFTAKGFGSRVAVVAGIGLLIGYAFLCMSTLLLSSAYLVNAARWLGLSAWSDGALAAVFVVVLGSASTFAMVRGIGVSARVALAVELTSIAAILVVLLFLLLDQPHVLGVELLTASGSSLPGIGLGVALAVTSFVGFESSAALGVEARDPHRSIPRAIMGTAIGAGLLYLVSAYTQVVGLSGTPGGLAAHTTPLTDLARTVDGPWLTLVLDLAIAASGFACTTGSATALSRLVFSMSREGVTPRRLGRTSVRRRTPSLAIYTAMGIVVVTALATLSAGASAWNAFRYLIAISTFGYMLAYILVCLALPRFLHRIGELSRAPLLAAPVAAFVLVCAFVASLSPQRSAPYALLLGIFTALVVAGWLLYAWRVRQHPAGTIVPGVYDEPTTADVFDPARLMDREAS